MNNEKRILIAEDDSFLKKVYESKFVKAGFTIKLANDGVETIKILDSFAPDVILLDIIMPKKDGFDTLKEIRGMPKWKSIPIIMLSNLGQEEDKKKAMELGATYYSVKSETPIQQLVEIVEGTLKK